jgi:hypothetical protein
VDHSKGPGSASFLLVGLVLLVTLAGVLLTLMPAVKCPSCCGHQNGFILKDGTKVEIARIVDADASFLFFESSDGTRRQVAMADITGPLPCDRCGDRKRVSVFSRLLH